LNPQRALHTTLQRNKNCVNKKKQNQPAPRGVHAHLRSVPNYSARITLTVHLNYSDGVDGAPTGIDVPRWSLSQPI
jgi:hypothetical protein